MIRIFRHYVPNAVMLLGLIDLALLVFAAELGWAWRSHQLGSAVGEMSTRWPQLLTFAAALQVTMMAVGVYGADALQSLRIAVTRLIVATALGVIGLSAIYYLC